MTSTPTTPTTPLPQPDIRPLEDCPPVYLLAQDYEYRWTIHGHTKRIRIPAGFAYDGASVPRLVWSMVGLHPDGLLRAAALVHDWIYVHGGRLPPGSFQWFDPAADPAFPHAAWRDVIGYWQKKHADRMFARLLREAGVNKLQRRLAYRAVRLFGRGAW